MLSTASVVALLFASSSVDLAARLKASGRPVACRTTPGTGAHGPANAWTAVRAHERQRLCRQLARLYVALRTDVEAALEGATQLERDWPGRPEPKVLRARALGRLGQATEALRLWQQLDARGYVSSAPSELWARASATALAGRRLPALERYRRLVTLVGLWPDAGRRRRLYLEAAAAALAVGPEYASESAAYLAEARRGASSMGLRALVDGMSALTQWWSGTARPLPEETDAGEIWLLVQRLQDGSYPRRYPRVGSLAHAAASLLVEPLSRLEALALWNHYVRALQSTSPDSPLLARARTRQQLLQREDK